MPTYCAMGKGKRRLTNPRSVRLGYCQKHWKEHVASLPEGERFMESMTGYTWRQLQDGSYIVTNPSGESYQCRPEGPCECYPYHKKGDCKHIQFLRVVTGAEKQPARQAEIEREIERDFAQEDGRMAFVKAERKRAKARVALAGPSGSGKSYSGLLLAKGLANGGRIAAIDTEHGSLSMYSHLLDFDVCELAPPYTPEHYIEAIREAEAAGYDTIIIDSITHEWNGEGGILQMVDAMPGNDTRGKWKVMTPRHDKFINAMLQSPCHIIATMRSKAGYVEVEKAGGGKKFEKKGMEPQQRDGMEYEFTLMFDIDQDRHIATASKDRTTLFDGKYETITEQHGVTLRKWLDGGAAPAPTPAPAQSTMQAAAQRATEARDGQRTIRNPDDPCTEKQANAIKVMAEKLCSGDMTDFYTSLSQMYRVSEINQLSKGQASEIYDDLKRQLDGGQ